MGRDFDSEWSRKLEHEPTYNGRPRPSIPLSIHGAVKQYIARLAGVLRCSACERPIEGGERCAPCEKQDCRAVECECGWLAAGEPCQCGGKEAA